MMRRLALAASAAVFATAAFPAKAGPAEDATAAITKAIDVFNGGDASAWAAAHQDGAVIVDEFAPYVWGGPGSAQQWLDSYAKYADANGITGGHLDYGKPLQAVSNGNSAYVVLPTAFTFMQGGKKWAGKSSMTFVMHMVGKEWKIASWAYAGETAKPE